MFRKIENKKFKKMMRDPKQFFLDSKSFKIFAGLFHAKEVPQAKNLKNVLPEIVKVSNFSKIDFVGADWEMFPPVTPDTILNKVELINECGDLRKPVVLLFGFSKWKMQFITNYLSSYRVAFLKENISDAEINLFVEHNRIEAFIVWGCEIAEIIELVAKSKQIPVWKMEDGFFRSFKLGSDFTLPQSLVLDKTGMYFDARSSSDLEDLLNTWDFDEESYLQKRSDELFSLYLSLRLSKYNNSSAFQEQIYPNLSFGLKEHVILVVGQLESDASILYGDCIGWTNERLIALAEIENPNATIVYRPHPDEVKKNKSHVLEIKKLFGNVIVTENNIPISEHFKQVARVYTMTSLAGFEALLHGVAVTVVGLPFYAGWGLTDDRSRTERRARTLTLKQLFCIAYVIYPKYIANLEDPISGLLASMQQVVAERELAHIAEVKQGVAKNWSSILSTKFWSAMVLSNSEYKHDLKLKAVFANNLPYEYIFNRKNSPTHSRILAYLIAGVFESTTLLHPFLVNIAKHLDEISLKKLLVDLWEIRPSPARMEHWAKYCEDHDAKDDARQALEYLSNATKLPQGWGPFDLATVNKLIKLAAFESRNKNFDVTLRHYEKILLSGHSNSTILHSIAQIAISRFEYKLAHDLYKIIRVNEPNWLSGNAFLQSARLSAVFGSKEEAFIAASAGAYINPNQIALFSEDTGLSLSACFEGLPFAQSMARAADANGRGGLFSRASADISVGDFERAELKLSAYRPKIAERDQYNILLSQAKSFQGKTDEATYLIKNALVGSRSKTLYREAIRVATQANDVNWLGVLLNQIRTKNIEVSEAYLRKAATVTHDVSLYYRSFRDMGSSGILKAYLGKRYIQSIQDIQFSATDQLLILAYFGPGDEIRWASLYPKLMKKAQPALVKFTCDPRLYNMFARSFAECIFVPSKRTRNITCTEDIEHIKQLPGSELFRHMDNIGWKEASQSTHVSLQLDLIADIIESHDSLDGKPYLKPDPILVQKWKNRVAGNRVPQSRKHKANKKVGICWRSSLQTTARNQYYLEVLDVVEIIKAFPEVDFYCLQYDDCQNERLQIEQRLPGKFKYFDDLDYYDDFENLSALMVNLDVVVSPGTTVVELAGALGVKSLFFSNTAEADWRYKGGTATDVWQNSIKHVKADVLNDKLELVHSVKKALREELKSLN